MKLNQAQKLFLEKLKAENDRILAHEPRLGDLGLKLQNRTIDLILNLEKLSDIE